MIDSDDISLFPVSARIHSNGHLTIANHDLEKLAQEYGTPLYLYDGETIIHQINSLFISLKSYYPGDSAITYAAKAYFSSGIAKKMVKLNIGADVVSLGEIKIAHQAGFSAHHIHLHGNNKTKQELQAALDWGIQAIVVDNLDELEYLAQLAEKKKMIARVWLRITPDLRVNTHPHIETSTPDSKFGLHIQNNQASQAVIFAKNNKWIDLVGLHTHLGSQLTDPTPYAQAIDMLYELAEKENFIPQELSPGGGWGVRYLPEDPSDDCNTWVKTVSEAVQKHCERLNWPLPRLILEPGRWVVARAGVALYRVGSQKITVNEDHIVAIDGGMSDNPRPALYQARYTARIVHKAGASPKNLVRIVGKFCESGDILIPQVLLPDVQRGDLLAVPAAGAYQLSMASNYNLASRPTVLWLENNKVEILQKRENPEGNTWWNSDIE